MCRLKYILSWARLVLVSVKKKKKNYTMYYISLFFRRFQI